MKNTLYTKTVYIALFYIIAWISLCHLNGFIPNKLKNSLLTRSPVLSLLWFYLCLSFICTLYVLYLYLCQNWQWHGNVCHASESPMSGQSLDFLFSPGFSAGLSQGSTRNWFPVRLYQRLGPCPALSPWKHDYQIINVFYQIETWKYI